MIKVKLQPTAFCVDTKGHVRRVRDEAFWTFAAEKWHRLYSEYVPYRTGALMNHVRISPGEIEHTAPYARYVYEGNFHFRTDRHPKASRKWDLAAAPTQLPKLADAMQAYVDSGRMNFNG